MNANAVIYARFSSDRQREESIEGQLRECREYADKNGIRVIDSYIDRALSASKDTDKRLDFQRMIRDSGKHLFDTVLVWKLDRFARNRYDSAHYKNILKKNGVRVVSATEHITEGPEGIILESMLEGMAEYYSAELAEKIRRGQKDNALKCHNNGGPPPFGYFLIDHHLQIDPATAPVVLEIFKRYAEGETLGEIIEDLNGRGIKTRKGNEFKYSSFNKLLQNRAYIGEFHYSDTVIPDGVPAIVPQELFDRVQMRREKNKRAPAAAKADDKFLLTTKLFCGKCGRMMVGDSGTSHTGKTHHYYKCGNAKRKKGCDKKAVKKEWIENLVVEQTMAVVMNGPLMEQTTERLLKLQGEESFDFRLLKKQLAEVEKGIENMLNAIQMGIITPSTKQRLAELEEQKNQLEQQILMEQIKNPVLSRDQIAFFIDQYRKTDIHDETQRQRLIDCFVNAVFVYDDKIVLTFNYKDGAKTIVLDDVNGSDMVDNGPPSGTEKRLVLMNNQNELFLFPAFRLICPMSAIHPLPFSHSKHHSLISQKARCKPSRFFHAQKEESAVPEVILSDYFYGAESEEFIYFKIPRLLITDPKFKHVSTGAKLLYGMLLDRMGLSAKNNWYDNYGRVYIYYTVDEICEDMCCGRDKAMKLLAELDKKKGIGLVERVKQGQGRPTKLYVKRFTTRTAPSKPTPPAPDDFMPCPDVEKNHPKTSEKSTSRRRKKPPQEVEKTDPNHTEGNQPNLNHPDPSIPPPNPPGAVMGMDRYELREEVKANIDFENLQRAHPYDDVESLLELVVDVLGSTAPTLRIAGESLPADTVKQRFRKLDSTHIEYIIEAMSQTTTKINNIRAYLLTALYNAPVTMGPYYSAAVRHDFG